MIIHSVPIICREGSISWLSSRLKSNKFTDISALGESYTHHLKHSFRPCKRASRAASCSQSRNRQFQLCCLPVSAQESTQESTVSAQDGITPVGPIEDLFEFICKGPLLQRSGCSREDVAENIDLWLETGVRLCSLTGLNEFLLTEAQKIRIYHYYVPVYLWCLRQLLQHRDQFKEGDEIPPLLFGVSAPQGSGKTTLVYALEYLFNRSGRKAASVSIDDFYLKSSDQAKLAVENSGNKLLELRGNAGSHDLELGCNTLKSLLSLTKEGTKAKIPRYDKSANSGRGDRANPSTWPEIEGPLEVAFLEGWMLGFRPLSTEHVKAIDPQLEIVNQNLELYYESWEKFIASWIIIKVDNLEWVYTWRLQAEIAMKADGKPGMSDEEVFDFVARYMPAYKAYLSTLYTQGPIGSKPDKNLIVEVDENRNPRG